MKKLITSLKKLGNRAAAAVNETLHSDRGDSHIVAVVLVVVIVIALGVLFREKIFDIVDTLFDKTDVTVF